MITELTASNSTKLSSKKHTSTTSTTKILDSKIKPIQNKSKRTTQFVIKSTTGSTTKSTSATKISVPKLKPIQIKSKTITQFVTKSTTTTKSTTNVTTTATKIVLQSSKPSSGPSSCTCEPKFVKRTDVCMNGSDKWKDEKTRARYLRVATMSDAVATKYFWCKKGIIGKWQLSGGNGIKIAGWGYKCDVQNYGQPMINDQGCPGFLGFTDLLMCLACPVEG